MTLKASYRTAEVLHTAAAQHWAYTSSSKDYKSLNARPLKSDTHAFFLSLVCNCFFMVDSWLHFYLFILTDVDQYLYQLILYHNLIWMRPARKPEPARAFWSSIATVLQYNDKAWMSVHLTSYFKTEVKPWISKKLSRIYES